MDILIVDDDKLIRLFFQSLLSKKISCNIIEAGNGLDALVYLESNSVDLILLDISMPVMDGFELLKIIRSTPAISSIPVIVMSSSDEKNIVIKLIQLGISDYLLKPFKNRSLIFERVLKALPIASSKKEERKVHVPPSGMPKLLIIDKDPNFRTYFTSTFLDKFLIYETGSAPEGIRKYLEVFPGVVCISEGIQMMSPVSIATKISSFDKEGKTRLFYFYENADSSKEAMSSGIFGGAIKKSFVPDVFRGDFLRVVLGEVSSMGAFIETLKNQLPPELITSIQQTFGVMTMQEVSLLHESENSKIVFDHIATTDLIDNNDKILVRVGIAFPHADIISLARKIDDDDDMQSIIALLETIAGRICSSLSIRGYNFAQQFVKNNVDKNEFSHERFILQYSFETESKERFSFGLIVESL